MHGWLLGGVASGSLDALAYLAIGFALFYAGLRSGPLVVRRAPLRVYRFALDSRARRLCLLVAIASLASFAFEAMSFLRYYGSSFSFLGGAYYEYAENGRGLADQVLMVVMQLGSVAYLLMRADSQPWGRARSMLVISSFWTVGFYSLIQGSRFSIAISFILFCVVEAISNKRVRDIAKNSVRSLKKKKAAIVIVGLLLAVAFFQLMDTKLIYNTALTKCEINPGDQTLKPFWESLYYWTNGKIETVYDFCDYLGEAPFIFSGFWSNFMPEETYPFMNTLRPFAKLGAALGLDIIADPTVVEFTLTNGIARYTSFQWNLLVEFGIVGGLIASYVFGFIMAKVERYSSANFLCHVLYPCLVPMCAFAPLYFFNVGRLDWIIAETLIMCAFLALISRGHYVEKEQLWESGSSVRGSDGEGAEAVQDVRG